MIAGHPWESLSARPHHDGSPLYVGDATPSPGDRVRVRMRVPAAARGANGAGRVRSVHVRVVVDGEQEFVEAVREPTVGVDTGEWWSAELTCHNPITHYRFLVLEGHAEDAAGEPSVWWLNGAGLHGRDVPDAADFRLVSHPAPPDWAQDAIVYQVFPDRFARDTGAEPAAGAGTPRTDLPDWAVPAAWDDDVVTSMPVGPTQVFGGTLDGVRERLDHLVDLGVTVLYLTPFFPARSNHRYDAGDFEHVDPVLGGDEAFDRLVAACHERGLRMLGDITSNHTGDEHTWYLEARADPEGERASWYVRDPDTDEWITWLGVPSLPKLDHRAPGLRRAFIDDEDSAIRRWLARGLDGWRVDVANMTGRYRDVDLTHEVARAVRSAAVATAPEALVVAEHVHDHSGDVPGDGWHGVMNYSAFADPVWAWLRPPGTEPRFLGSPVVVPRLGGQLAMETVREFSALDSWRALTHSMPLLGSHDTTRPATLLGGDPHLLEAAIGLLLSWPGLPMMTYGDEIGMEGAFGEDGRRPMPWPAPGGSWAASVERTRSMYRSAIAARRDHVALRRGGLRWLHADDDCLVFVREHEQECVLVHVARAAHAEVSLPIGHLPGAAAGTRVLGDAVGADVEGEQLVLRAQRAGAGFFAWPTPPAPPWRRA